MSANWKRQLNITKKTLTVFLHILQNFVTSHIIPLQLFFHTSLLFWLSHNSDIIHHCIIIIYLFLIIPLFSNSTHLIIPYLFFIISIFINSPHLFFIRCYLFITDTDPPFSLILVSWHIWWIPVTHIFLKGNTTTQVHINNLNLLLTSDCWFSLWDISPWIIKR